MKYYGLYIHIPFCKSKCNYCGFYSCTYDKEIQSMYIDALINEMSQYGGLCVDTIYIGGGTPSVIELFDMEKLLKCIHDSFKVESKEFTIEMNPESVSDDKLKLYRDFGVNRVSLGVQSLDDSVLNFLGRVHTSKDAKNSIEMILRHGFELNCDIIYDIPTVDKTSYFITLKELVSYPLSHVSAYNYSFDTDFLKRSDDDTAFLEIVDFLEQHSFLQYEISNFAKDGKVSKHNCKYWKMNDYIGIGISAHSMMNTESGRIRWSNEGTVDDYINSKHKKSQYTISVEDCIIEDIVFGIRMKKGVEFLELRDKYGDIGWSRLKWTLDNLIDSGLLEPNMEAICLTRKGQLFLDYVQQSLWDAFFS